MKTKIAIAQFCNLNVKKNKVNYIRNKIDGDLKTEIVTEAEKKKKLTEERNS